MQCYSHERYLGQPKVHVQKTGQSGKQLEILLFRTLNKKKRATYENRTPPRLRAARSDSHNTNQLVKKNPWQHRFFFFLP